LVVAGAAGGRGRWRNNRGVHPVYVAGLVAFAFRVWSEPLALMSAWSAFATLVFHIASSA
jgi:hypothetical protein